jgi:putative flippase GtrA
MARGYIGPVSGRIHGQLARFLVVGSLTVAVDFTLYRLLLWASAPVLPAKAASFVIATVLAYLLNRSWTFKSRGGAARAAAFTSLYGTTLLVNVGVNALALRLAGNMRWSVELAFLAAQACSTTLNFLAMRYLVFRPGHDAVADDVPAAQPDRSGAPLPRSGRPTT